jgi:hypothetical protein
VIPTRIHGIVDYLVGTLLIVTPFILGFADGSAAQWVPIIAGALTINYSLLTDYERGLARVLPMRLHLYLDMLVGSLVAISPWLFGFADRIWWPHVIVGVMAIAIALTSRVQPTR